MLCSSDEFLQKTRKNQNHKILYSTATWDSVEVALERALFQRIVTNLALWLRSGGNVYKNHVQIQWITKIKRTLRQDKICSPPGCCSFDETQQVLVAPRFGGRDVLHALRFWLPDVPHALRFCMRRGSARPEIPHAVSFCMS